MELAKAQSLYLKYGWRILEERWRYYVGRYYNNAVTKDMMSDEEYDKLEKNYHKLCDALKQKRYSTDMVSFTMERASTRLVHEKMCKLYELNPKTTRPAG